MSLPKGMTSEAASITRAAGHINERHYADIIGGRVSQSGHTQKKDVIDSQDGTHSVKSGKKWQMFLYSRSRLENNTMLRALGDIAELMIACIDSMPATREERQADADGAKRALQQPMRALSAEISQPKLLEAFFLKTAFEAGEVDYWAILPPDVDQRRADIADKHFHVFDVKEAVKTISSHVSVENSRAYSTTQMDAQKVIFRTEVNIAEIEIRTDPRHYREVKMWFDAKRVLDLLQKNITPIKQLGPQVTAYGRARKLRIKRDNSREE